MYLSVAAFFQAIGYVMVSSVRALGRVYVSDPTPALLYFMPIYFIISLWHHLLHQFCTNFTFNKKVVMINELPAMLVTG